MISDRVELSGPIGRPAAIGPIVDEPSYRAAILVLDRLFDLGGRKTSRQLAAFRDLALQARDYEVARSWASA